MKHDDEFLTEDDLPRVNEGAVVVYVLVFAIAIIIGLIIFAVCALYP